VSQSHAKKKRNVSPAPSVARESTGPRSDAKQQTRAALVAAAARAFHERGLDASLDEICAAAGYTRGAFYVHFKDREDLIAAVLHETNKHRVESLIASGEGALDLERTILMFAKAVRTGAYPGVGAVRLHQFLAAVDRSEPVRIEQQSQIARARAKLANAARDGQRAGTVRADVKPEEVADLLLALVSGIEVMIEYQALPDVTVLARALLRVLAPPGPPAQS
jgi:AcrR family transcriptional regulator